MRFQFIRLCSAALLFAIFPCVIAAQKSAPDPYSSETGVLERVDVVYAMNADGTGYMQKTVVVKIQTEAALQQLGILGMRFAANTQHAEFHYVRARHPDGSVTETPVSGVMEQPMQATVQAPFYSDLKVAQLPVKSLQVGDTLEWEARVVMTKAEAHDEFWGAENFVTEGSVVREESVELHVPTTKAVTVWTNPALGIKVKQSKDGDQSVYRWETSALRPTVGPEAEAAKEAKKKHVLTADEEMDEEQGKLPSVAWTTFPSWAAVGEWYRGLELSRATPDDEVKAKVAELTAGKATEEDKARAIYQYVSTQIRYIGVAFGVGRYQPHEAVDVLHNQYGDCKDKATLLTAMLAAAGMPSDAALIGAGLRFNQAVPSPASFNHLITHLKLNGQDVWLDSTEEVAPYRMMHGALRDREALIVPPTGTPTLEKTPKDPPFSAFQTWTAKGTLDTNGVSDSQITVLTRGDDELAMRAAIRQLGPAQYDEMTQRLLGMLGYAGKESHAEFSHPDDVNEPFRMSFGYHREKAGDWDNLRIIPQLAPVALPAVDEKEPPVQALRLGTPRTETSTAEMKLPAGWTAELPEAVHEKSAYATYDLSYRVDKGTLYAERKVIILQQKVPVADWKTYKKFADAAGLGNEVYVQLRRANGESSATVSTGNSEARVQELLNRLDSAYQRKDVQAMEGLLKELNEINPKAQRLMAWTGSLALLHNKPDDAIEDNRKELALYPDEFDRYSTIVWIELRKNDKAGAETTLRSWAKADASDPQPLMELSQLLVSDKEAAAAVNAAKDALSRAPDGAPKHDQAELTLGQVEMEAGMVDKANATFTELLKATNNPVIMNDASYFLAHANQDLPLAETSERKALERFDEETSSWTLDESPAILQQKTAMLISSWDTMGWILYREGRLEEAKSYLDAAWMNRQDAVVTEHRNEVNAALEASDKPHHAQLPKADVTVTASAPQGLRTFPLGPANGRHGVAEYRLLLAHGRVERMEPTGEKTVEGADAMVKHMDFAKLFPEGSDAKLVRGAMVNCFSDKCQLVLEP
jgi:tetratricopeptide (TPR) repeat protein